MLGVSRLLPSLLAWGRRF